MQPHQRHQEGEYYKSGAAWGGKPQFREAGCGVRERFMRSGYRGFQGCSRGWRKRRISTNRIHLCPSSAPLPTTPAGCRVTEARPGQCPPQGGGVRVSLSQAQPSSHWSPRLGRGRRRGRQESVPLDFHVSNATRQLLICGRDRRRGRRMTDEGPRRSPLRWTHTAFPS